MKNKEYVIFECKYFKETVDITDEKALRDKISAKKYHVASEKERLNGKIRIIYDLNTRINHCHEAKLDLYRLKKEVESKTEDELFPNWTDLYAPTNSNMGLFHITGFEKVERDDWEYYITSSGEKEQIDDDYMPDSKDKMLEVIDNAIRNVNPNHSIEYKKEYEKEIRHINNNIRTYRNHIMNLSRYLKQL